MMSYNSQIMNLEGGFSVTDLNIMVVDDDPRLGELISFSLSSKGVTNTFFNDPLVAAQRFEQIPTLFNAGIFDNQMPGITGLELARRVRLIVPGFPIFIFTGGYKEFSSEEIAELKRTTITDMFSKPFRLNIVDQVIQEAVRLNNLHR